MSERGDSNSRPLRPERSTLPTALLSDCLWRCKVTKISRNLGTKDTFFLILSRKKLHVSKKLPTFATAKPRGTRPRACKEIFHGVIAQLVEQRTENPCVPGSIPGDTTRESIGLLPMLSCVFASTASYRAGKANEGVTTDLFACGEGRVLFMMYGTGKAETRSRLRRDEKPAPEGNGTGWIGKTARGGRLDGPGRLFGRPEASNQTARGV